jgi:glutathione S-transferase
VKNATNVSNPSNTPALELCELADASAFGLSSLSPFCLKVHCALHVAGLPYARRHGKMPSAHRAVNPAAQVPVLLVDGAPIADSTRILAWIDERTQAFSRGLSATARGEAWLWEDYADTALNAFLVAARWADDRNWSLVREAYFGAAPLPVRVLVAPLVRRSVVRGLARDVWRTGPAACWERFGETLDRLDARAPVEGGWVGGGTSVADVAIFAQLHELRTRLTGPQAAAIAERRTLSAYLDRVGALAGGTVVVPSVREARGRTHAPERGMLAACE